MSVHLLGIRHHGPGSCRNVLDYLRELAPDLILLEGPAEAEPLVPHVADGQMKPPVALLAYQPDCPQNAVFYPYAEFSPEWQTLRYAVEHEVPLRFFDLPLAHAMALKPSSLPLEIGCSPDGLAGLKSPFDYLAEAAGYPDGETWWEVTVEQRKDNAGIFRAVQEAVTALRSELPSPASQEDLLREAWMRRMIRTAQKEGFERIAVVCGAWHVPALADMPKAKEDNERLRGLDKVKVACTWVPWTYDRLAMRSGYGAGIESPGWYHYLWQYPDDDGTLWVSRAAGLLRRKRMDISVAHVIETVRLAQATAALRDLPAPTLADYNEAITAVMGFGDDMLLHIIREKLTISNRLGTVPGNVPKVPLLTDVEKIQKRLRVPFTAEIKELVLDLRKTRDLERSIFFHRLNLLEIKWAVPGEIEGQGTFKEKWTLYHTPELIVSIIEKGVWGNTLQEAVQRYLQEKTCHIGQISALTRLLSRVILADLPPLAEVMATQLDRLSAASTDILEMMGAIPYLANIVRYGNVRQLDFSKVGDMLHAMTARILAGGVLACIHINEEAATDILERLAAADYAIATLDRQELSDVWHGFICRIHTSPQVHPLLSGYATRLLNDRGGLAPGKMQDTLGFYASPGNAPADVAYWLEGFLRSSGSVLLLDEQLWNLVNNWVCAQTDEHFTGLLPILKRTFCRFTPAERRKLGEKAKHSEAHSLPAAPAQAGQAHNGEEAAAVLPLVCRLLGIETT